MTTNSLQHTPDGTDHPRLPLEAPRSSIIEFLLFFFTFNLYACIWCVKRARDLKRAGEDQYTPWLWFFVPFIAIAALIAFPRMFKTLKKVEGDKAAHALWFFWPLWVAAVFFIVWGMSLVERFGMPISALLWLSLCLSMLFALLHSRFNAWKTEEKNIEFYSHRFKLAWYEWLMTGVLMIIPLFLIKLYMLDPLLVSQDDKIESGVAIVDDDGRFSLTIYGEGWSRTEVGTFSDGTAEVEFRGPPLMNAFMVFDWGTFYTLDAAATERIQMTYDSLGSEVKCEENRELADDAISVKSIVVCEVGTIERELVVAAFIESDGVIFELLGQMAESDRLYRERRPDMLRTARSFEAL